ncbi:MAG: FG-GAP repeat protein [Actinobacteria bacterium]|nr:FG-GAP repeat protein [Actinomycetota bacterium]
MRRSVGPILVIQAVVAGLVVLLPAPASAAPPGRAGDFNGDGFADLAVGVLFEDVGGVVDAGGVNVIYGSANGLSATTVPDQFLSEEACGGALEEDDHYGAVAAGDLNGDGYDDLAMGGSGESVGADASAGAVCVVYGSAAGLTAAGAQLWHQDVAGVEGGAEAGDLFGWAVAIGDFNLDGYGDLAVGVPGEDVAVADAGAVNVLYGGAAGLSATEDQVWTQDVGTLQDAPGEGDFFGWSLAVANLGNGAHADLAIGVPAETVGGVADAGAVAVLYGTAAGLSDIGNQLWTQDTPDVNDSAEASDLFGYSLAAANFGKGGTADLAIGVSREIVGGVADAGAVAVLYGTPGGLSAAGDQLWHQNAAGVLDAAEAGDQFGYSLAAGNLGRGKLADLAVGVPKEDVAGVADAGAVHVLYGSSGSGLQASNDQFWTLASAGLAGPGPTFVSWFGWTVEVGAFGNGGPSDLAVSALFEDVGGVVDAGTVRVLYGSGAGLASAGSQFWHQNRPNVDEAVEAGDGFGYFL